MREPLSPIQGEPYALTTLLRNQDTNDRFMANIQRNGTFSIIPRIAAGEVTPDKLIILGQVAKKCMSLVLPSALHCLMMMLRWPLHQNHRRAAH